MKPRELSPLPALLCHVRGRGALGVEKLNSADADSEKPSASGLRRRPRLARSNRNACRSIRTVNYRRRIDVQHSVGSRSTKPCFYRQAEVHASLNFFVFKSSVNIPQIKVRRVLTSNQSFKNRKRNLAEVYGGVVEADSKRGSIASGLPGEK